MKEIEIPRRQTCACGDGCEFRSSVKWQGVLVVDCVSDDDADNIIRAIIDAARWSRRLALLDAEMAIHQAARAIADLDIASKVE